MTRTEVRLAMRRAWRPLLDGAARAMDLSANMFTERRPRSVADLSRAANLVTSRAFPEGNEPSPKADHYDKLFVGNLAYEVSNDELAHAFADFGDVLSAAVIMDRATGRSKGFGFVEMAHITNETIQSLDGAEMWGRRVTVSHARPSESASRPQPHHGIVPVRPPKAEHARPANANRTDAWELQFSEIQRLMNTAEMFIEQELILVEVIKPDTELAEQAEALISGVGI